jgi:hypothetical protein
MDPVDHSQIGQSVKRELNSRRDQQEAEAARQRQHA